jgi:hypothetical protein
VAAHTASAQTSSFEALVPEILGYWQAGHAATILGQANSQNAEVVTTASGVPLLVLAGTSGACVAAPLLGDGYVATCAPVAVATGGLGLQVGRLSEMVGIVPDGNANVTVTFASGSQTSVPVTSNAFAVTANPMPVKATYQTASGAPAYQQGSNDQ